MENCSNRERADAFTKTGDKEFRISRPVRVIEDAHAQGGSLVFLNSHAHHRSRQGYLRHARSDSFRRGNAQRACSTVAGVMKTMQSSMCPPGPLIVSLSCFEPATQVEAVRSSGRDKDPRPIHAKIRDATAYIRRDLQLLRPSMSAPYSHQHRIDMRSTTQPWSFHVPP